MSDDATRESPLQGKQLVFLFMSVTVLAVVIFLCGVMVGRGVRDARGAAAFTSDVDPTASATERSAEVPVASTDPRAAAPNELELQYPKGLTGLTPPSELPLEPVALDDPAPAEPELPKSPREAAAVRPQAERAERPSRTASSASTAGVTADTDFQEPSTNGFVVQVHAARQRAEAAALAKRLASKGYTAFITTSGAGAARMYRVRVGKFPQRREAEAIARRLETEEQFKPWITR